MYLLQTADYNSAVRPITTMTDCEIVLAFTLNGWK